MGTSSTRSATMGSILRAFDFKNHEACRGGRLTRGPEAVIDSLETQTPQHAEAGGCLKQCIGMPSPTGFVTSPSHMKVEEHAYFTSAPLSSR